MGKAKKAGIGAGITLTAFFALVVIIGSASPSASDIQSNLSGEIREPVVIDGLKYDVNYVGIRSQDLLVISLKVENVGTNPADMVEKQNYKLMDSKDRAYDNWYGSNPHRIPPGMNTELGMFFQVPFDQNLAYTLMIGGNSVYLGEGSSFIDEDAETDQAIGQLRENIK